MTQTSANNQNDSNSGTLTTNSAPGSGSCSACGHASPAKASPSVVNYVYALGRVEPLFPRQSIEKEFAQLVAREDTNGLTDRQTQHKVLSQRSSRYLARQMCWSFNVEGLETYLLIPRDPGDVEALVEALRPEPSRLDLDVVVGSLGPIAPPDFCNGVQLPIVVFDQIYSFDWETLIEAIPRPKEADPELFRQASSELLDRVLQMADNSGSTDGDRALNYLTVRYPAIYLRVVDAYSRNCSLSGVSANLSNLGGPRKIVDVVFSFVDRRTDVTDKFLVRVDVSDEFPFLVTKLSPYYDR